jgi:putative restriction endonuclease
MPWSKDQNNRMNPMNGLALNGLHDRAFETGLIAIDSDYKLLVSSKLKNEKTDTTNKFFQEFEGKEISLPDKFRPSQEFLKAHLYERFKG